MRRIASVRAIRPVLALLNSILLTCLYAAGPAGAQSYWQGSSYADWGTASNWSPNVVPGSNHEDVVNNTANGIQINSGNWTINSFNASNNSANLKLFGGSLNAYVTGVSAFNMAGNVVLNNGANLAGFVVNTAGVVTQTGNTGSLSNITFSSAGLGYTGYAGSTTYISGAMVNNNSTFFINAGSSNSATLALAANTTLSGGGTLTLQSASGADVYVQGNGYTLNNSSTIVAQTSGQTHIIGNGSLALINSGTIESNNGAILTLNGTGGITNTGTLEASNGGTLTISGLTVDNAGGVIETADSASHLLLQGATVIQGGTVSNAAGGLLETASGTGVTLDGSTHGAVTLDGTYIVGANATINMLGTVNNAGTILLDGKAEMFSVQLNGSTTLTGGGALILGNSPTGATVAAGVVQNVTVDNINETISGAGEVSTATFINEVGGTVISNQRASNPLSIFTTTITNSGTFDVDAGAKLVVANASTTLTNFSGNTLTGGTWIVNGTSSSTGTLQLDPLGLTGGEIINNAAVIELNGLNSNFVDGGGQDALSNLAANTTSSSELLVSGGRTFSTSSSFSNAGTLSISGASSFATSGNFTNAGTVSIGSGSIMQIGSAGTYTQTAGVTTVKGTLDPFVVNLLGGELNGAGTVSGNVVAAGGSIQPGQPGSVGMLTIDGSVTDTDSTLDIRLGGAGAGQYDVLNVDGNVNLGSGSVLDVSLVNGFTPTIGETFMFLDFSGSLTSQGSPDYFATDMLPIVDGGEFTVVEANGDSLELQFNPNSSSNGTPEPGPVGLLFGVAVVAGGMWRRRR